MFDHFSHIWLNRDPIDEKGFEMLADALPLRLKSLRNLREISEQRSLYQFVDNSPVNQVDLVGLWHWGWPPWGPKPPPPPPAPKPPPLCPSFAKCAASSKDLLDCIACCEQTFVNDETLHPKDGPKNLGNRYSCVNTCNAKFPDGP